jgi:hypothetical protein
MQKNSAQIEALLVERLGYERRGKHERAAAVGEQLRLLGYVDSDKPIEAAVAQPTVERATKRRVKRREA